jgi:integrase
MPKLSQKLPAYRLHRASGKAIVTLNGKDVYLGEHNSQSSRDEYDRVISEWLAKGRAHSVVANRTRPDGMTIAELLVRYLKFAQTYYVKNGEPTGELHALQSSMKPLAQLFGKTAITLFGPNALKQVRQKMIDGDLCRTLVNARIKRIRRIFKWGVENELVDANILHGLQAVSPLKLGRCQVRESTPVKPIDEASMRAVLPHVNPAVAAMIELQWLTGMRPGEVCRIRGIELDKSGAVWIYKPSTHKTEHHGIQRIIHLGPQAQAILRPFLKSNPVAFCFSPREEMAKSCAERKAARKSPMTPSQAARKPKRKREKPPGEVYTTASYGHSIAYGCVHAKIPRWSPNRLRHSAATRLRKDFGLDAARVILGHTSTAITEVYAEIDHTKACTIMASVG